MLFCSSHSKIRLVGARTKMKFFAIRYGGMKLFFGGKIYAKPLPCRATALPFPSQIRWAKLSDRASLSRIYNQFVLDLRLAMMHLPLGELSEKKRGKDSFRLYCVRLICPARQDMFIQMFLALLQSEVKFIFYFIAIPICARLWK